MFPKKKEKITTGIIDTTIVKVSCHEITKRKMNEVSTKMTDRMNIATLVESPFCITAVSEESLLTN
jgi:hypothetical protein